MILSLFTLCPAGFWDGGLRVQWCVCPSWYWSAQALNNKALFFCQIQQCLCCCLEKKRNKHIRKSPKMKWWLTSRRSVAHCRDEWALHGMWVREEERSSERHPLVPTTLAIWQKRWPSDTFPGSTGPWNAFQESLVARGFCGDCRHCQQSIVWGCTLPLRSSPHKANLAALSSRGLERSLSSVADRPRLPAVGPQQGAGPPKPAACQGQGGSAPVSQPSATSYRDRASRKWIHKKTRGENRKVGQAQRSRRINSLNVYPWF